MSKLWERLLRPFRSHTTVIYYDEYAELDKEKLDEVWEHMSKTFKAMDKLFKPPKKRGTKP